jgi:hypothetical protein
MFDSGKDYNLLAMDGIDPNDIATLLKLYLRERKWSDTLRQASGEGRVSIYALSQLNLNQNFNNLYCL